MYNKWTNIVFYELCLINILFFEMVSYLSDSPQNAKNKMLYQIITAKW